MLVAITLIIVRVSFALEKPLRTEETEPADIKGIFTLILYGSRHINDIETVAILDFEGDRYIFEPYAPEFNYRVSKNVPAKEALEEAKRFVSWHSSFYRFQTSRIVDNEGRTIGYEIRPLYRPLTFGLSDVLDIDYYMLKDSKVRVIIRLTPLVERQLSDGDGPNFFFE